MKQLDQLYNKVIRKSKYGYVIVGLDDYYRLYNKTSEKPIKNSDLYKKILRFIFVRIWHYIFKENWRFKAPVNFGQFFVAESYYQKSGISTGYFKDWVASKNKGKLVNSYNFHTSGRKFFIKWDKSLCKVHNHKIYRFVSIRGSAEELTGKRGLAAWINKCSEDPYLNDFRGHLI